MIESLAVSRASGTLVLSQLQASELIVRNADPGDARRLLISLTAAGRDLEQPIHDVFEQIEAVIRTSLEAHEVEACFQILGRMFIDVKRLRGGH
jgi:DNA-binding MarR family transcriptional regulator